MGDLIMKYQKPKAMFYLLRRTIGPGILNLERLLVGNSRVPTSG